MALRGSFAGTWKISGLILLGIEEEDDSESGRKAVPVRPISGIREANIETTENELKSLLSHIHPRPVYHLLQDKIDDRFYIILAVEPGNDGPYVTDEKAEKDKKIRLKVGRYIRIRRDSRIPNKREEFELLKKFADYHFTSELNETATLDDLNYEYMKEYLVRTNAATDIRALSKQDMAKTLHLVSESEYGGLRAKNFAVLMFADRPADFIPYAYVEVIREAVGTDKMESKRFDGPVWIQAQQAIRYFEDNFHASYTIRDPLTNAAHIVDNWPSIMFAELATNAILHKEYSNQNYVGIYIFKDHIGFINHNRPLPPVTIEDMNTQTEFLDRNYLNKELKEMFFNLNLIQSYGSGIRRAKIAMSDNGSPALQFSPDNDTDDYTQVVAYINDEFARIQAEEAGLQGKTAQETAQETFDTLTDEEKIVILLINNPLMTRNELAENLDISSDAVKRRLEKLKKEGKIERQGSTKAGKWVVLNR